MSMGETAVKNALVGNVHLVKQISGYSAYEVAVANGFNGTQKEWLESLKGEPGYTPVKGVDYFDGKRGEPGTMELHGDLDALGERIKNVADPVDDMDVVNKKYLEEQNSASKDYVDETFVKKDDQLDANDKTVVNVASPVNDTDAVNKKYVHDNFQNVGIEDISDDFIKTVNSDFTVANKSVFKQGNIISGSVTIRGDLNQNGDNAGDILHLFQIKTNYKPKAAFCCPSKVTTYNDSNYNEPISYYLAEAPNVYIDSLIGYVQTKSLDDLNRGFANEIEFGFTYLSV